MLKKLVLKAGANQENTRYLNENGWWSTDKVRFRQGTPEKIGGWSRYSANTFLGICRSLHAWTTLLGSNYMGVGTHLKYYIEEGGVYNDVTPLRLTTTLTNPFTTTLSSPVVSVAHTSHGAAVGDYVTFSGASAVGGLTLNGEFSITAITNSNAYTITASSNAASGATGGGASVTAAYQIAVGQQVASPTTGWGTGYWGYSTWGSSASNTVPMRIWSATNFGEDLLYAPRGGALYFWDATTGLAARGVLVSSLVGASNVPTVMNQILVSDASRFVMAFGVNDFGGSTIDPLLIRWTDQESMVQWTPSATTQAGSYRLSRGTAIVGRMQGRQEILVWTDTSLYSMQYVGPPAVWSTTLVGENCSLVGPNAMADGSGATYWMGLGKFYKYDGRLQTLRCDLRQMIWDDINTAQYDQVACGTNEGFNEIWWFYPSAASSVPDKYVVYNYLEDVWYFGNMTRYAWLDSGVRTLPTGAMSDRLVYHEIGLDDLSTGSTVAIPAFVESSEFDIDDGDKFGFVWRVLPDLTFRGSTNPAASAILTLYPMANSGSGIGTSVGGSDAGTVLEGVSAPVEQFTGQVNIRVRGRQMILRVESTAVGVAWQVGGIRIDLRQDGRR